MPDSIDVLRDYWQEEETMHLKNVLWTYLVLAVGHPTMRIGEFLPWLETPFPFEFLSVMLSNRSRWSTSMNVTSELS